MVFRLFFGVFFVGCLLWMCSCCGECASSPVALAADHANVVVLLLIIYCLFLLPLLLLLFSSLFCYAVLSVLSSLQSSR